jgi:DNA-binding transcriptional LysR family regulator
MAAPAPKIAIEIKLAWHERTHHDAAIRAFREVLVKAEREGPKARASRRKIAAQTLSRDE